VVKHESQPISLPPIVKLGAKLGLEPLPLTVDEFIASQ